MISQKRKVLDGLIYGLIYLCVSLSIILLAGIIIYVFVKGVSHVN